MAKTTTRYCAPRQPRLPRPPLSLALAAALTPLLAHAQATDPPAAASPEPASGTQVVTVLGSQTAQAEPAGRQRSDASLGFDLRLRDTPQSISTISRQQMDDFALTSANALLASAPGVTVEQVETDRTYYTARGFDITNFQIDGLGLPMSFGLQNGDLDTALYERVDVVRGAAGLLTGTGNPSATVNFVRKRPTAKFQASAALTAGSWNDHRLDADISGALNDSHSLRGRLVLAGEDQDSHLDRYHGRKGLGYGVLEADLGPNTLLTLGASRQNNRPTGVLWGALPLAYSDGTATRYDRSTSTSPSWTYWNSDTTLSFASLQHQLANDWQLKAQLTHKQDTQRSRMVYVYGTPDAATGTGLAIWPSIYQLDGVDKQLDLRATGPYTLGGRQHTLVLGASAARSGVRELSTYGDTLGQPLPELGQWNGELPIPNFSSPGGGADFVDRQRSAYAATQLNPQDGLRLILGANATRAESEGQSYGVSRHRQDQQVSPHLGVMFDLTPNLSVYASHTALFTPQAEEDAQHQRLAAATGRSQELGLKSDWLAQRLTASVALFQSRQNGLATYAGTDSSGQSYYQGQDSRSQGVELEVAGEALPGWSLNAGYTGLAIHDDDGLPSRPFSPRHAVQLNTTWQVPQAPGLKLGAQLHWRSAIHNSLARQNALALLDLMASYRITPHWSVSAQLRNATDETYLNSLYWSQAYYAAPRNGSVTVQWTY